MIEYTSTQKEFQFERMIDDFYTWVEELASFHQVTCDYILEEFIID